MSPSPPPVLPAVFIGYFPKLQADVTAITGSASEKYNCVAWALGRPDEWWWPSRHAPDTVWNPAVEYEVTVSAFVALFQCEGFELCEHAELEPGFIKIAIYVKERIPTHVARQLPDGQWTSKMGPGLCLTHRTLQSLEGDLYVGYGRVEVVMKRKV